MSALAHFLQSIFDVFGLPPWAGGAVVLGAVLLALPWILRNRRTEEGRKRLRKSDRLRGAAREAEERAVLALVGTNPWGLLMVGEEAHRMGRDGLAADALAALLATGKLPERARRLQRDVEGPMPGTALEAALTLERFVDSGMLTVAVEKAEKFAGRWPGDPELDRALAHVEAARAQLGNEAVGK